MFVVVGIDRGLCTQTAWNGYTVKTSHQLSRRLEAGDRAT